MNRWCEDLMNPKPSDGNWKFQPSKAGHLVKACKVHYITCSLVSQCVSRQVQPPTLHYGDAHPQFHFVNFFAQLAFPLPGPFSDYPVNELKLQISVCLGSTYMSGQVR